MIEAISEQLSKELPGLRGFSAKSIRNMRLFFEEWGSASIWQSVISKSGDGQKIGRPSAGGKTFLAAASVKTMFDRLPAGRSKFVV